MDEGFNTTVQVVALIVTGGIFLVILDLVRRRRLVERYALLWLTAAVALLVLAVWRGALDVIADLIGVAQPANAIFLVAFGVGFVLLLHFSVAISRLSEETKILAQEVARLEQELRATRGEVTTGNGAGAPEPSAAAGADQPEDDGPVGPQAGAE